MHFAQNFQAAFQLTQNVHFLWLIVLFPLLGAVINGIAGKKIQDRLGKKANHAIAVGAMVASSLVALFAFVVKLLPADPGARVLVDRVFPMIHVGSLHVDFSLLMDQLSGTMTLIITLIGTGIHIYSIGYMAAEKAYWRFFSYMNLFIFAMLLLVLGDSFVLMFFGWEGVGLCSYLLIGFWYTDLAKATAGMKAFVVNRIGDFAFISGLFLLFWGMGGAWTTTGQYVQTRAHTVEVERVDPGHLEEGAESEATAGHGHAEAVIGAGMATHERFAIRVGPTVSFHELAQQMAITDEDHERPVAKALAEKTVWGLPILFVVCLLFFVGATGKSAQIPLYVWLPDAMAGPTPVSALIHAATMVTAGVYMIARLNFLYYLSPGAMSIVALVGAVTALYAATIGLFQYDIKKVLAYSTVSQLGFMFLGVGVGAWWAGAFHLLTHACFKACLFLGSGSVIHGMHFLAHHAHDEHVEAPRDLRLAPDPRDPQDMRNMGGLAALMPHTRLTYLIACISIAGFPVAAGFFSKDEILWKAMSNGATVVPGWLLWAIAYTAAGCTAFYMFRSYYMTFRHREATAEMKAHVHESPKSMTWVLIALAALAVLTGPLLNIPFLHHAFENWLTPVTTLAPFRVGENASHGLEIALMFASVGVATLGWWVARSFYADAQTSGARLARMKASFAGVHRLLWNKYWVDEIYQATFVRGFIGLAKAAAWVDTHWVDWVVNATGYVARGSAWLSGFIDRTFVDGAVNGLASVIVRTGREARRVQTGRINNYVYGVVVGVIALVVITTLVN